MRGDLSTRYNGLDTSFAGVLFQQGRVFTDRDSNAQTAITTDWEDTAGRDIIGAGILAVPAEELDSFKVESATLAGDTVTLTVDPGRAWADGLLVRLDGTPPITLVATPFGQPIQDPPANPPADGDRDAVVLEVWRHEVHGFQLPDTLIEAALGGVDTTERIATGMRFRLYRMDAGDTCESVAGKVADDPSTRGKLTATLQPTVVTAGDCPTVEGGGYTGFEHSLYRLEIAATDAAPAMVKWSRFNGGLVGRGTFDAATLRAQITANLAAIASSDLTDFYLETVEQDLVHGDWAVTYGAPVSLVGDELVLPAAATYGAIPAAGSSVFFRLWNGIRPVSDFPAGPNPTELEDGILLQFDADTGDNYRPDDYWVFQVRADGLGNASPLLDDQPPEGIVYHRVSVAELLWDGSNEVTAADGTIEDCRVVFQPITRSKDCCTYRVGDGLISHGDFTSIQAAVNALPAEGGKICILPGAYVESVLIDGRTGITVSGCGRRSAVTAPPGSGDPVFHVRNSTGITLESLAIEADTDAQGVLLEAGEIDDGNGTSPGDLERICLDRLFVHAQRRSAIECRDGQDVTIIRCTVWMDDLASNWPGVFVIAQDSLIAENEVFVVRRLREPKRSEPFTARGGLGGIQLGGGCERVRMLWNLIQGGVGNGITLGSISEYDDSLGIYVIVGWVVNADDPCNPCKPGDTGVPPDDGGGGGTRYISDGPLFDILIEDNRILDMGLNGIGVIGFFELAKMREIVSVHGLRIIENEIRGCLQRALAPIRRAFGSTLGYGGISLADTSSLEIRENIIEDNGPDWLEPICGIYVLHGAGVEIVENRITDNGAQTDEASSDAKPGPRGGIYIASATPPLGLWSGGPSLVRDQALVLDTPDVVGGASLRVHDNRVVAPLGRALTASTLGDVTVHGNHLTTLGVDPSEGDFLADRSTTVLIQDLGRSSTAGNGLSYRDVAYGRYQASVDEQSVGTGLYESALPEAVSRAFGGDSRVLFSDNQVALLVQDEERRFANFASVSIISLGDVGIDDNQFQVQAGSGGVIANLMAYGFFLRVADNSFVEGFPNAIYSAMTLGVMNMTTANQAVHCLIIRGYGGAGLTVAQPNSVLLSSIYPAFCRRYTGVLEEFGKRIEEVA